MVSSSKSHYPSRRSRRTAAVITASLLTSSVSPVTAFAQDPVKMLTILSRTGREPAAGTCDAGTPRCLTTGKRGH